jgi:hypothetical protein
MPANEDVGGWGCSTMRMMEGEPTDAMPRGSRTTSDALSDQRLAADQIDLAFITSHAIRVSHTRTVDEHRNRRVS